MIRYYLLRKESTGLFPASPMENWGYTGADPGGGFEGLQPPPFWKNYLVLIVWGYNNFATNLVTYASVDSQTWEMLTPC